VVVAALIVAVAVETRMSADSAPFEAESMTETWSTIAGVSEAAASGGKALKYTGNGIATKAVDFSAQATTLEVRARGTLAGGAWPTVSVFVDGTSSGAHDVATKNVNSSTYQTYTFPVDIPAGPHTIRVKGLSDVTSKRALYVDLLAFTHEEEPPPPPAESGFNPGVGKGDPAACDKTLQPGGNVETFANGLAPGERGCLRGGLYTTPNSIGITANGATLAAYPGERTEIRASFSMNSSQGYELEGLYVDASYSPLTNENNRLNTEQAVNFNDSTNAVLDSVELTNRRDADHSGTCVFGGTSQSAVVENSWVYRCGEQPSRNREHGFYVANSTGMLIKDTWISDVSARGIQLYSAVRDARVVGVVIDSDTGNTGIAFNGDTSSSVVENSVVRKPAGDATVNVGGAYAGSNNRADNNCLWTSGVETSGSNVTATGNVIANPQIAGFTVTNPTCAAKLPADSPFRPASGIGG
jgi:hypothetical protein